jgi:Coenzyme PQQ synthesis protein D (PqqD)
VAGDVNLVPTPAPGVATHRIEDDVLLFDGTALTLLTGNRAAVARLVDGTRSTATIARATGLPEAQVSDELVGLAAEGLIARGAPAPDDGYRRPDHVGVCRDKEQVVLLDLRDGERHVLSPSATAIWMSLMATGSVGATVAELEQAYPDAPGLPGDVAGFVSGLESQGLVERASGMAP